MDRAGDYGVNNLGNSLHSSEIHPSKTQRLKFAKHARCFLNPQSTSTSGGVGLRTQQFTFFSKGSLLDNWRSLNFLTRDPGSVCSAHAHCADGAHTHTHTHKHTHTHTHTHTPPRCLDCACCDPLGSMHTKCLQSLRLNKENEGLISFESMRTDRANICTQAKIFQRLNCGSVLFFGEVSPHKN